MPGRKIIIDCDPGQDDAVMLLLVAVAAATLANLMSATLANFFLAL